MLVDPPFSSVDRSTWSWTRRLSVDEVVGRDGAYPLCEASPARVGVDVLRSLSNTYGFATNCFVCEPTNGAGLRVSFSHDDERNVVVATTTFGQRALGRTLACARRCDYGGVR